MKKINKGLLVVVMSVFCAGSVGTASSTIYQQDFTGSGSLSDINWSALAVRDFTGENVDVSDYTGQVGLNNYGYFAPHLDAGSDAYNLRVAPGLVYTDTAEIQIDITSFDEVTFETIGDPTNASFRLALKVGGQWYAQVTPTVDSRDNPGPGGEFLSAAFAPADFAGAANWLTVLNAAVGSEPMTLGASPSADLSGSVEAIGLYLENASDHLRFDAFRVSGVIGNLDDDPIVDAMLKAKRFQEWSPLPFDWLSGTFYSGVTACYEATGEPAFLDAARAWCASGNWEISTGTPLHADAICTAQTFLDVYFNDQETYQIQQINELFETYYFGQDTIDLNLIGSAPWSGDTAPFTGRNLWWWCDALYMAPPLMARLGAATGDDRYYDLLHELYWDAVDYFYNEEEQLFFRDAKYFNSETPLGQPVFWARGNGWVIGGLVRTIDYLPQNDPMRADYIALFQDMMERIVTLQGDDGLWRSSLNEPSWFPMKESSGSSFFCFALAAGINRGWLHQESYQPYLDRAWDGLLEILSPEGIVQWSQPVAQAPGITEQDDTRSYTQGAFLLAASEVYKARRTSGKVLYSQSFEHPGSDTNLSSVGWSALAVRDFTGKNIDVSDYTVQAGRGSDYAFFAPHLASGSDANSLRVAPALFYTEAAEIQVDIGSLGEVAFDYIGDATDASFRVAVKVGGQWYAQAVPTVDIRDNPGPNGGFLNASFETADFAGAANWLTVSNAAVDAVEMTLGATPAQSLSGTVEAIGLYLENTSDHLRFDNFSVGVYVAPSVMISTTDGTGGVSGQVDYDDGGDFGGTQWHVKNPALGGVDGFTRKGYVRFDTSAIDFTATDASLELTVSFESLSNGEIATIHVYGITDQSLDMVALDGSTTWANAPANDVNSGDTPDLSQATLLGTFTYQGIEPVGTVKTFSSSAFIDFLNADTNGLVTFFLGRTDNDGANRDVLFAGDTHATYASPKLWATAEKPILTTRIGNGVSGYVRDNGSESFGGAAIAVKDGGSGFNRKGYLRFDLTSRGSSVFDSASLKLVLDSLAGGTHTVAVYGLTDESLDDWDPSTVTYATAPANDASSGSAFLPLESIYLGEIELDASENAAGDVFTVSTPELTSFLNDDTNGLVTLMLSRTAGDNDYNPIFAGDLHATYDPPTLVAGGNIYSHIFPNDTGSEEALPSGGWNIWTQRETEDKVTDFSFSTSATGIQRNDYFYYAPRLSESLTNSAVGLAYTQAGESPAVSLSELSQIKLSHRADGSSADPAIGRFAIQLNGQWYASDVEFSSTSEPGSWVDVELDLITWTDGANWREMTVTPAESGGELSVAASAVGGTLSGDVTQFGVFMNPGNDGDHFRVNDFSVTAGPHAEVSLLETWQQAHFTAQQIADGDAGLDQDPDRDSLDNLVEYALGGSPMGADATAILPTAEMVADGETNWFEYVYRRRNDHVARGLIYTVEVRSDLLLGDWTTDGVEEVNSAGIDAEFDSVANRISTEGEDQQFLRLKIEKL